MSNGREDQNLLVQALLGPGAPSGKPLKPEEMIENLQRAGYEIIKRDVLRQKKYNLKLGGERFEGGKLYRFGIVSDTQFGSQKQQKTMLNIAYDRFEAAGIKDVFHCGDLFDGDGRVYPGQEYDLFIHGYDRQLDYGSQHYPKREGITTHVIAGNHDWSFWQRKGADILKALAERRKDIHYLGPMAAQVTVDDGFRIQLLHMKGSLTYARSYKLQKIIEQFAPEQKPEMLFCGDKHSWAHVPMYRNVYGWQVGCFQAQTEHEKRLGLYPELGALIVEVLYGTKGADRPNGFVSVRDELVPFYVPRENDY